jgi:hypothetical protein
MSGEDKDLFERLSQITPPEPDPKKIKAVAAVSASAFAENSRKKAGAAKKGWLENLLSGRGWLIPASGAVGALLVAVLAVPMILDQTGRNFEAPQDTPSPARSVAVRERDSAASEVGTRMGSMPQLQRQGLPLDLRDDVEVQTYDFDGLEIVSRSVPEEFGLYLAIDGIGTAFDQRAKEASEEIVLTDAFVQDGMPGESDRTLFVRSGYDDGAQQWDAFVDSGNGFVLSGSLSMEVHDASDRAEVRARLEKTSEN